MQANPGMAACGIAKILGQKWSEMGPAERQQYEEMAAQDKLRYQRELAEETAQNGGAKMIRAQDAKKQQQQPQEAQKKEKKKTNRIGAYIVFTQEKIS